MMEKEAREIFNEEIKLAKERLETAKLLLEHRKVRDAINRAYYAMFNAARALLRLLGIEVKSHEGLITEFGLHIINKGMMDRKYGRMLRIAFEARSSSDYRIGAVFDDEEADNLIKMAEDFIKEVEKVARSSNLL